MRATPQRVGPKSGYSGSVRMRLAGAAQPARTRLAGADRLRGVPRNTGREDRQFLLQPRRAAVRTFSSLPVGGPHEDFAGLVAFVTMKFVDRHGAKVAGRGKISSRSRLLERLERPSAAVRRRSCARHELRAAARAAGLVRRFGWTRHRSRFIGLQTGPLKEFFRGLLPGGSKPLFGRHGFRLIRGTNRQQRITQVEQSLSGKTLEAARRTQNLGHSQGMKIFQKMPGKEVGRANGGWRREEYGEKSFQAFLAASLLPERYSA
jgi:hypothetical protein